MTRNWYIGAVVIAAGALTLGCTAPASAETTTTDVLAREIPIGPADEDAATSAAITRILLNCADAYRNVQSLKAKGTYIYVTKEEDGETSYTSSKVSMVYRRPDKMAIVCESDDVSLDCAFYANGTTATHVSTIDQAYVKLPQPDSLAAYAENYRSAELFEEYSGALAFSVTGPILVSEDPKSWLFEDVSRFIYEGREDVHGVSCYRVRFIQHDPDVIVIIWVNEKTWLIDKASFISSYDEDYNMVESFEEGDSATMSILTWDTKTTDPKAIKPRDFRARIPKGFTHSPDEPEVYDASADKGWWESIVGLAAQASPEETTWSLTRQTGAMDLHLSEFAQVKVPVVDLDVIMPLPGHKPLLAVGSEDGNVALFDAEGVASGTLKLGMQLGLFSVGYTETSSPLFITVTKATDTAKAFDQTGAEVWSYHHPYTTINVLSVSEFPETGIYLGLSGDTGLRKLSSDGKVLHATTKVEGAENIYVTPPGDDRVVVRTYFEVHVIDSSLKLLKSFMPDETMGPICWDPENDTFPLVCVSYTSDMDVLLQRRAKNGDIAWTTMVQPKADSVTGSGLSWVRLPVNGKVQTCAAILLSDGTVVVASKDGDVLYRGLVQANDALVKKNNDNVLMNLVVADLDSNGIDEIYTRMDKHLMRIAVEE